MLIIYWYDTGMIYVFDSLGTGMVWWYAKVVWKFDFTSRRPRLTPPPKLLEVRTRGGAFLKVFRIESLTLDITLSKFEEST